MAIAFREIFQLAEDCRPLRPEVHLGSGLVGFVVQQTVANRIAKLRALLEKDGYALPSVRLRDRPTLSPNEYEVDSDAIPVAFGISATFDEVLDDLADLVKTHAILVDCLS